MSRYALPRRANPSAPYWLIPIPCPQPAPRSDQRAAAPAGAAVAARKIAPSSSASPQAPQRGIACRRRWGAAVAAGLIPPYNRPAASEVAVPTRGRASEIAPAACGLMSLVPISVEIDTWARSRLDWRRRSGMGVEATSVERAIVEAVPKDLFVGGRWRPAAGGATLA